MAETPINPALAVQEQMGTPPQLQVQGKAASPSAPARTSPLCSPLDWASPSFLPSSLGNIFVILLFPIPHYDKICIFA